MHSPPIFAFFFSILFLFLSQVNVVKGSNMSLYSEVKKLLKYVWSVMDITFFFNKLSCDIVSFATLSNLLVFEHLYYVYSINSLKIQNSGVFGVSVSG